MKSPTTHFQFTYNLTLIDAEKKIVDDKELYTLSFSNEVPPITILSVKLRGGSYEWDTVPPGNTELACSMGKLIEQYNLEHSEDETETAG